MRNGRIVGLGWVCVYGGWVLVGVGGCGGAGGDMGGGAASGGLAGGHSDGAGESSGGEASGGVSGGESGGDTSTGGTGGSTGGSGASGDGSGGTSSGGTQSGGSGNGSGGGGTFTGYEVVMSSLFDGADTNGEQARDVAFDAQGNFVMVGGTSSPDFPTTAGAYDTTHSGPDSSGIGDGGDYDVFVTKFDAAGDIIWSTFLGNGGYERAYAVEFGPGGDVYVAGRASIGFPTTAGVYQETFQGDDRVNAPYGQQDGFVAKLSADGSTLAWSTFVGEGGRGLIRDIDVDAEGKVYLAMANVSGVISPSPTTWGPRSSPTGYDAFYGVLSPDGTELLYGNYMGGSADSLSDGGNPCVRLGSNGDVFVLTYTDAADFSCVGSGVYDTSHNGAEDLVLVRYTDGATMDWCTFLGGSGSESVETHSLAVGVDGNPIVATATPSIDVPITPGAVSNSLGGTLDAYAAILSADGQDLLAATYFGGSGADWAEGVAIAPGGDIVFSGGTDSADVPVTPTALKASAQGRDGWIVRLSADLGTLRYASYYGGSGQDDIRSLWVSPAGGVALVGSTTSSDFPVSSGASGAPAGANSVIAVLLEPLP